MKITITHKNKAYSISYRQVNENEPLQANGIRMLFLGMIARHEPDMKLAQEEMNKNDQNIEVYQIEVSN